MLSGSTSSQKKQHFTLTAPRAKSPQITAQTHWVIQGLEDSYSQIPSRQTANREAPSRYSWGVRCHNSRMCWVAQWQISPCNNYRAHFQLQTQVAQWNARMWVDFWRLVFFMWVTPCGANLVALFSAISPQELFLVVIIKGHNKGDHLFVCLFSY